jgi:hypothetical protein
MFATRTVGAVAHDLESTLAFIFIVVFTAIVTLGTLFLLLNEMLYARRPRPAEQLVALWIEWALVATAQLWSVRFLFQGFDEARFPRAVWVALRQRFPWDWTRPLTSLWWLANALGMLALGELMAHALAKGYEPLDRTGITPHLVTFLVFTGCS